MRLSTTVGTLIQKGYTHRQIVDLMANAGFDALDFSFISPAYHADETDTPEFTQSLRDFRLMATDRGLSINQAHAPFFRSKENREQPDMVRNHVIRAMRYASILGVPHIVVHPVRDVLTKDPVILSHYRRINLQFFNSLLPYCQEYGIQIAVENMNGSRNCAPCGSAEDFSQLLEELDSNWFTACLDIGHARLCGDPADYIRTLGPQRLTALHVHDVDGTNDSHTIPYLGVVDWNAVMTALGQIGYTGDFTFEAGGFHGKFPQSLDADVLGLMARLGRQLIAQI